MIAIDLGLGHTRYLREEQPDPRPNQYNRIVVTEEMILNQIRKAGQTTVEEIAVEFDLSYPHTNSLLKRMTDEGILTRQRQGYKRIYTEAL